MSEGGATLHSNGSNSLNEWTLGGFFIGVVLTTIFWCAIFMLGPRYIVLNNGKIIETIFRGYHWEQVSEKPIEAIIKSKWSTTKPALMWGEGCDIQNGRLVCTSGGYQLERDK